MTACQADSRALSAWPYVGGDQLVPDHPADDSYREVELFAFG
jgi:hypothetical protein